MNPSEAKVFSAGISGFLSSKSRKDVSYSRLSNGEDSLEFSTVNFQKDRSPLCAKVCFGLLALLLLSATVATAVFIMNFKSYTVEVQLKKGNVLVYKFDQEVNTINGKEKMTRNTTAIVAMHVVNKTESECWFGVVVSFPKDKDIATMHFNARDFAFLTRVNSAEQMKHGGRVDGPLKHFTVYGNPKTDHQLTFYVHNVLNQLLPYIKVKLYEFVLSKVSSSSRSSAVDKHGFFPGRVHLKQTMITTRDAVTVTTKANPGDFESFVSGKENSAHATWKLKYDETTVVNKKTGMVKRGDMKISGMIPLGGENGHNQRNLTVTFKSVVKLLDQTETTVNDLETVLKKEKDINHPLSPPSSQQSKVLYFAPLKKTPKTKLAVDLKELLELGKHSSGRIKKLPSIVKIVHHRNEKSIHDEFSDSDDGRQWSNNSENPDGESDNGDDEAEYDADENDNDDDEPQWTGPNFAPFRYGYDIRKKRALKGESKSVPVRKVKHKATKKSQQKRKSSDLDVIWDELKSSSPEPIQKTPRVIQTSILGLPVRAEIEYEIHAQEDADVDDEEDWDVTTSFLVSVGEYRVTAFKRVHRLDNLRKRLPRKKGHHKTSQWTVNAGDFVICAPLFYIQRLCSEVRLTFDVTVTYSVSRLSLSYPVDLAVHIEQTVKTNVTLSAHASTWLLKSGFYTKGTVAVAHLPVGLSFSEDTRPEWCTNSDLEQKLVRINSAPFLSWKCATNFEKLTNSCNGLPSASNGSSAHHDLRFTSAEGAMFENWHYPISCVHRRRHSTYRNQW